MGCDTIGGAFMRNAPWTWCFRALLSVMLFLSFVPFVSGYLTGDTACWIADYPLHVVGRFVDIQRPTYWEQWQQMLGRSKVNKA